MNPNNSMGSKVSCRRLDFEKTNEHEDNHDIGNEGGENDLDHLMGLNDDKNLNKIHSSMPEELIPTINMEFDTEDMACEFYIAYAKEVGFGIRRSKSHNDKTGKFIDRTFCCSAEGKRGKDKRDVYAQQSYGFGSSMRSNLEQHNNASYYLDVSGIGCNEN
ncbi:hypothetical protein ACH5RR_015103 [Cinchona calisaya]|uniref:FAR1 domain-containing protein n=1 Tax=Cinchona calisaya TaxID=153742 RepID=A0ABD2ZS82_9GENT